MRIITPDPRSPWHHAQVLGIGFNVCLVLDLREYSILNFNSGRKWGLLICWIGSQQCTVIQHITVVFLHSLYLSLFLNQSSPLDPYFHIHFWCIFLTFHLSGKWHFVVVVVPGVFSLDGWFTQTSYTLTSGLFKKEKSFWLTSSRKTRLRENIFFLKAFGNK